MKEIDKIRIRQWNQDNPYIQMKNLENAQPGYRVHTVNDDHHLYELPLETQNIILDWVFWNFYPAIGHHLLAQLFFLYSFSSWRPIIGIPG